MKKITKLIAGAGALLLVSGCAYIGADQNADGTYKPNARLPGGNSENRVDALKPTAAENDGPSYSKTEEVRPERGSDELLGGPEG